MLTRRRLLATAAGAVSLSVLPVCAAPVSDSPWSREAARTTRGLLEKILRHPFLQSLAAGTLPREAFVYYLCQNLFYLESYARTFRRLADRLDEEGAHAQAKLCRQWVFETVAIEKVTRHLVENVSGRPLNENRWAAVRPTVMLYADFEAVQAAFAPTGVAMAACLPCFTVYDAAARSLHGRMPSVDTLYGSWLAGYDTPEYRENVLKAVGVADYLASRSSAASPKGQTLRTAMTQAYEKAMRMEWMLWDAAWHQTDWPV